MQSSAQQVREAESQHGQKWGRDVRRAQLYRNGKTPAPEKVSEQGCSRVPPSAGFHALILPLHGYGVRRSEEVCKSKGTRRGRHLCKGARALRCTVLTRISQPRAALVH